MQTNVLHKLPGQDYTWFTACYLSHFSFSQAVFTAKQYFTVVHLGLQWFLLHFLLCYANTEGVEYFFYTFCRRLLCLEKSDGCHYSPLNVPSLLGDLIWHRLRQKRAVRHKGGDAVSKTGGSLICLEGKRKGKRSKREQGFDGSYGRATHSAGGEL